MTVVGNGSWERKFKTPKKIALSNSIGYASGRIYARILFGLIGSVYNSSIEPTWRT